MATAAGDTHHVYPFALSRREENERKKNNLRKKRDISVPKKVAEFLEADRRKIEAQGRSDRRHLSKGELEPMLDRYVTGNYNTEETALKNLTLENLRSAIVTLDTDGKKTYNI